jgi:hypothetical protein
MRASNLIQCSFLILSIVMSGCATLSEQTFMNTQGNTLQLVQNKDMVKDIVIFTLTEKGFQTENNGNSIKGVKKIQDNNRMTTVTIDCSLMDNSGGGSSLQTAAMKEVYESSTHVKIFWLVFIPIPYGTYTTCALVASDTIYDKEFYATFFDGVKKNLAQLPPPVKKRR